MSENGKDMLVAAPERWDEVCFAVPALRALMASGLGIGVICPEAQLEFWKSLPGLEILPFPSKAKAKTLAPQLRDGWKSILVWEPGLVADASKLAGIPRRLGPAGKHLAKWLSHPLEAAVNPLEHRVRFYLSAIEEMGIPTANPEFFKPAALGIDADSGLVLLSPDSDFGPSHEWPLPLWAEIALKLTERGLRLSVAGIEGGREIGAALARGLGSRATFFQAVPFATNLPRLAAQSLVIAADGSLPHLAAHAGATCVTLFGPNDPAWKRPLGRQHAYVRHHVECAPCLLAKCPLDQRCQNELEIGRVWTAVEKMIDRTHHR